MDPPGCLFYSAKHSRHTAVEVVQGFLDRIFSQRPGLIFFSLHIRKVAPERRI